MAERRAIPAGPVGFVRGLVEAAFHDVVTTMFPADCRVCGGPLLSAGMTPVCGVCTDAVREQTGVLCRVCGEALGMESLSFASGFGEQ